ncbi:MAG: IS3 family transposase [Solirubrobacterales bacterium]
MRVYRFIDCQKAEFAIKTLCRVCEVSRAAYYAWASAEEAGADEATWDEAIQANRIHDIWARSRGRYGVPRVTAQLCRQGSGVNHKRVERIMAELGLQGACGRRKLRTTVRDPGAAPAPDLVQRHFTAPEPDTLWIGDLTYIPTDEGWLYLATVIDTFSRRLLGWSMADHMRTELCADALNAAGLMRGRCRFEDLIFHSDHGCQYTSGDYKKLCKLMGITQSMGTVGDSYDNAMAESFFASLKRELVDDAHYCTKQEARTAIFEWIMWYNRERLHSSLGYMPPEEFEELRGRQEAA